MPGVVIAIGGGGPIKTRGTLAIDREILRLSGKRHPRLLFIPTASSDDADYWKKIREYFGRFLKCRTDVLFLIKDRPPKAEIRRKSFASDVIYVGGGNTLMMMRLWRRLGVDRMLRAASRKGIVLCGISAGAICWFDYGHSDSMSFYNPRKWEYMRVKGMGLIPGTACPHYNSSTGGIPRRKNFQRMIVRRGGVGIAIENNCAIEFREGRFSRVLRSKPRAKAWKIRKHRGALRVERLT